MVDDLMRRIFCTFNLFGPEPLNRMLSKCNKRPMTGNKSETVDKEENTCHICTLVQMHSLCCFHCKQITCKQCAVFQSPVIEEEEACCHTGPLLMCMACYHGGCTLPADFKEGEFNNSLTVKKPLQSPTGVPHPLPVLLLWYLLYR